MAKKTPFIKTIENPSAYTLFKWTIFEPLLLVEYADTLTRWQATKRFMAVFIPFIAPLIMLAYFSGGLIVAGLDLPALYPAAFEEEIITDWQVATSFLQKLLIYMTYTWQDALGVGLGGGLGVGLVFGLGFGLGGGLGGSLVFGLVFGLGFGLGGGLEAREQDFSAIVLIAAQSVGLYYIAYFTSMLMGLGLSLRFLLYPLYILRYTFRSIDFYHNPYVRDGYISPTLEPIDKQLIQIVRKDIQTADYFIRFLLNYRPLQKKLTMKLIHARYGGEWEQMTKLSYDAVYEPYVIKKLEDYKPTALWLEKIGEIKEKLKFIELQNNIGIKLRGMEDVAVLIKELQQIHLLETFEGKKEYDEAFEHWANLAADEIVELRQRAKQLQPISPNPYSKGKALSPQEYDIFLGREDLKDSISLKILTSKSMPMFLIQGQRRVGKTSLLKFLPQMLDPSRFKVVYQDMQDKGVNKDIISWLQDLHYRFNYTLGIKEKAEWAAPQDWIQAWHELSLFLKEVSEDLTYKVILAIDEYEELHKMLQKDPEKGGDLLATMRSFSQHQDKIAFMFIGAAFFYELSDPTWAKYFVQAERFKVDYLIEKDSMQLITAPTPEFKLQYEPELPEHLYQITQGHPHLLQAICSELVDLSNQEVKGIVTFDDLDFILNEKILDRDTQPFSVFWIEFCEKPEMKQTVLDICNGKIPQHEPSLRRILEHAYAIENNGAYQMRVPLFAQWVKKFGYVE